MTPTRTTTSPPRRGLDLLVRRQGTSQVTDNPEAFEAWLRYCTAKAIRAMQPEAKCFCTAITYPADYKCVLEKLKRENALAIFDDDMLPQSHVAVKLAVFGIMESR